MTGDRITELYEGGVGTPDAQLRARRLVRWMRNHVAGNEVLDVRCGRGIITMMLAREGKHVVGIDDDSELLEVARQRLGGEDRATQERVELLQADAGELPLHDASFDTVLLTDVLEHQTYPGRAVGEAARVLRTGGRAVISVPYGLVHGRDHKDSLYLGTLLTLVSSDLKPTRLELIDYTDLGLVALAGDTGIEPSMWRGALELADERLRDLDLTVEERSASLRRQIEAVEAERKRASRLEAELEVARAGVEPRGAKVVGLLTLMPAQLRSGRALRLTQVARSVRGRVRRALRQVRSTNP